MTEARLLSVQVGRVAPLGDQGVPSGFVKRPTAQAVTVGPLGLAGDEQADLSVHGGPEKAVYGYAAAHYPAWIADHPEHAARFVAGGLGENLTIEGLTEADLRVGDVHAVGDARLQVCQPRQPCFKFALRFGDNRLPKAMVRNGRSGWYYRVLRVGTVRAGDPVLLDDRPHPEFRFDRLVEIVNRGGATPDELTRMADTPALAAHLRAAARRALAERWA
ncbi:MAG TPA: MOSC domain-containing protein [Sphingomonas sp.]|jgi:MOSC domain-containing protein YiiM